MQVVIFCGGESLRFRNEKLPYNKVMAPIGKHPLLFHIMSIYYRYGYNDFILCVRDDDEIIRDYFNNQTFFKQVKIVPTGNDTPTGGRLARVKKLISSDFFFATYGDGLSDINISSLVDFHFSHGRLATLAAVHPVSQYGIMKIEEDNTVLQFVEKPIIKDWVNAGFFVFSKKTLDYLPKNEMLEIGLLAYLVSQKQLMAYKYLGFWKSMDTVKEFTEMNDIAQSEKSPFNFYSTNLNEG